MKILRWLETKRAPKQDDRMGGRYTPAGIDIYTTETPGIVSFDRSRRRERVSVENLLSILTELDRFEGRRQIAGEKIELQLALEPPPNEERGDVFSLTGFMFATIDPERKGLVRLHIVGSADLLGTVITADRADLRRAIADIPRLRELEHADRERGHEHA